MKFKIFSDFHDVFVDSNGAWIKSFIKNNAPEEALVKLENGVSRKKIAQEFFLDYSQLESDYRENLEVIDENIEFFSELKKEHEVHLISMSTESRLKKDLKKIGLHSFFNSVYNGDMVAERHQFLKQQRRNEQTFILFFNHEYENFFEKDGVIYCPISLASSYSDYINKSYVEHAKNKKLYNSLSKIYHLLLVKSTETEVDFLNSIFKKNMPSPQSILDCGCGIGRHSKSLSNKGYDVTGVDISPSQIETAKLNYEGNANFQEQDIRKVTIIDKIFDCAICMWTTYNYLSRHDDLIDFFKSVSKHLAPNGLLVLECKNIFNLNKVRAYSRYSEDSKTSVNLLIIKKIIDKTQNGHYLYFIEDKETKKITFCHDEELAKFHNRQELESIYKDWFDFVSCYGDFDYSEYNTDKSERLIIILRKKSPAGNNVYTK